VGWREARDVLRANPASRLRAGLASLLDAEEVTLHASGREALRVAFAQLASERGRSEVVIPAYTCWSVPAAAVAAGLQVRLVDVNLRGQIDAEALAKLPLERAAALVVTNLLGVPEPIEPLRALLEPAGVAIIDDAAQALGTRAADGPVGGRGDIGVLSFARGKPLSALGGGGLAWRKRPAGIARPEDPAPRRASALLRAAAYDLALLPFGFRLLAAVPALRIGETVYDPAFPRGAIDGASLCLASARLGGLERCRRERSARAESLAAQLRERTRFEPLTAEPGRGAYPRLGVVAPSGAARDAALGALAQLGATRLYPAPLDGIPALESQCSGGLGLPGARAFAERLLTLPVHAGLSTRTVDALTRALEGAE
jgi:dTDP-4-amino-4,6-dideoxygalactose transaminase